MKKVLVVACLLVGVSFGYSQGVVSFKNNDPYVTVTTGSNGKTDRLVYNTDGATLLAGTNYLVQLYFVSGTSTSITEANLNPVDITAKAFRAVGQSDGIWVGGNKTLTGVTAGNSATLQVRAWDGATGATSYAAALTAGLTTGKSSLFTYTVPVPPTSPGQFYMEGFQSFTMIIPEPTTIALGVLGAAGLLIARRRK